MNNWQILIVEDDPDGQEVVGRILRYFRVNIAIVSDAEEALEVLRQRSFTAVIIDLHLPGMDGWTLLECIRQNAETAKLPCFAVTAFHSADVAVKAIDAGFTAYFPKPLESTSFMRELERILNQEKG